MKVGIFNRVI